MHQTFNHILSSARNDVKLALAAPVTGQLLLDLISLLERGVAVSLIVDSAQGAQIREKLFLVNKCLILLKKGGEIYVGQILKDLLVVDYEHSFTKDGSLVQEAMGSQDSRVLSDIQSFGKLKRDAAPFFESEDDLKVAFRVSDDIILKGDEVALTWDVAHAETIAIEGIGEVGAVGGHKLKPAQDTVFKLGAYNDQQSALRTVAVKVYDNIDLNYDLSFANPRTGQFSSLVKEVNHPHVFGVAKGNVVRLKWEVKDSNEVRVRPFGIKGATGEHEFVPEENMTVVIEANVLDRKVTRNIQVLVFPIKLMDEKLLPPIAVIPREVLNHTFEMPEIIGEINNRNMAYHQSLAKIRKYEMKRYNDMLARVDELLGKDAAGSFDLDEANWNALDRLQKYYAKKPRVAKVLASIKSFYGKD